MQICGERHPKAYLTDDQVNAIRDEYDKHSRRGDGYSCRDIAQRYGSKERTIYDIVAYRTRASMLDEYL